MAIDTQSGGVEAGGAGLMADAAAAAGIAAYHWDIASDAITWSANAGSVLGCDPAGVASGRSFAALLDPGNISSRYEAVMGGQGRDEGEGVSFLVEYVFRPGGRRGGAGRRLEDQGRWFAGPDGRPVRAAGTVRSVEERHRREQHMNFLGHCDPLTGMMNRGRMMEALGGALLAAAREGSSAAVLVAAINNLPVVNEAFGFEVADEVIVAMGKRLAKVVRAGDAVARYSGSKFGLVLNHCTAEELPFAAERFLAAARESVIETGKGPVWALLSIGAVVLPRHAGDAATAIARAEEALTEARREPADGLVIYEPSAERSSARSGNARHATEIVSCLKDKRFELAFQPVVEAATGRPAFHEALLRMTNAAGDTVAAGHLIPVAEKLGLVRLIDEAVVGMAAATLARHPEARLSLNISGITATDPRWYPRIIDAIAANRAVAPRLIVEITETVALGDLSHTIRFVGQLRGLGCGVAIDDFGAGYTSFRSLRALPVELLKLDGSFCRNLGANGDNQYYVRSLIDLARTFGIRTVAEWVETEEDAELLRGWGIDLMQGSLFGMAQLACPWEGAAAPELPAPGETLRHFEDGLEEELAGLRRAIALLDRAFAGSSPHRALQEPSLADLVSDTARQRAM